MVKKAEALTLADFMVNSKLEESIKLPLNDLNGKPTKHYLMVRSSKSKSLQRDMIIARIGYASAEEVVDLMPSDTHEKLKEFELSSLRYIHERELAIKMVTDWSFDDFSAENVGKLLDEQLDLASNKNLAIDIIGYGCDKSAYINVK